MPTADRQETAIHGGTRRRHLSLAGERRPLEAPRSPAA
jgi:hypothetical protein